MNIDSLIQAQFQVNKFLEYNLALYDMAATLALQLNMVRKKPPMTCNLLTLLQLFLQTVTQFS